MNRLIFFKRHMIFKRLGIKSLFCLVAYFFLRYASFYYQKYAENERIESLQLNKIKVVQLLTTKYNLESWDMIKLGEEPFKTCPQTQCFAFRSYFEKIPNEKSDAIMTYLPELHDLSWKDGYKRLIKQLWLVYSLESPIGTFSHGHGYVLKELDNWFDLTVTYKPDSDLVIGFRPFEDWKFLQYYSNYKKAYIQTYYGNKAKVSEFAEDKSEFVTVTSDMVFLANNCGKNPELVAYLKKLERHIDFDAYGECEGLKKANLKPDPCRKKDSKDSDNCYLRLLKNYKFYLALEAVHCDHFITDKFWNIYKPNFLFSLNIIPVVKGDNAQYQLVSFEKSSFINLDTFSSLASAAKYFSHLKTNHTAFLSHLYWKLKVYDMFEIEIKNFRSREDAEQQVDLSQDDAFSQRSTGPFCLICEKIHDPQYMNSRINASRVEISKWLNPITQCRKF